MAGKIKAETGRGNPMAINYKILDGLRRRRSEHENHLIDCLVAGRVSRREFMRHGSVLGLSLPYLASVATAIGIEVPTRRAWAGSPGGTVRMAQIVPAAAIDPVKNRRWRRRYRALAGGGDLGPVRQKSDR
jgi:hypothetical protein